MFHDLFELLFKQVPLLWIAEGAKKRPEVPRSSVELGICLDVVLCFANSLIRNTGVDLGIALNEKTNRGNRIGVVSSLP